MFLHNDDRIEALIGVVGIALLIFGLIEADLRHRLPAGQERLPGLLEGSENSDARSAAGESTGLRGQRCPGRRN